MAILCPGIKGRLLEWNSPGSQVEESPPTFSAPPPQHTYYFNSRGREEQYIQVKIDTLFLPAAIRPFCLLITEAAYMIKDPMTYNRFE